MKNLKEFESIWETLERNDKITAYYAKCDEEYKATQNASKKKYEEMKHKCEKE